MPQDLFDTLATFFNFEMMSRYGMRLVEGLWTTTEVVVLSVLLGFVIAYPVCRRGCRAAGFWWARPYPM